MPRQRLAVSLLIITCCSLGASAQTPKAPAEPGAGQEKQAPLPPSMRLGYRVDSLRRGIPVIPLVVIVPDSSSYVRAISKWSISGPFTAEGSGTIGAGRFPVLIDNGTWRAREDIARFVRAFAPEKVVRWSSPAGDANAPDKRRTLEEAAAAPWSEKSTSALIDHWKKLKFQPPGIIAASTDDPAWTAALALGAARGEPIAWVTPASTDTNGSWTMDQADALSRQIETACSATGFTWDGLGDDIDAITLCLAVPVSIRLDKPDTRGAIATTDVVGRRIAAAGADRTDRWAWAGQIVGDEPHAAYMAMSALFLEPMRAWLFDGYENKEPWSKWDCSAAAIELEKAGLKSLLNDNGNQGASDWRLRCAGLPPPEHGAAGAGVDAGLIAVNSAGNADFFDLRPGQCKPGDVPFLRVPAIVHFVHSWSAIRPTDRATIAGRWLERGAYAYLGSVHEPFLGGFVPTPNLAVRLLSHAPWGAATRLDNGPPWKITVIGDPLIMLGAPTPRTRAPLPLEGAQDVQDSLAPALKDKRFAEALWILAALGRESDASRLIGALLNEDPGSVTPEVALAGISSAFLAAPPKPADADASGAARFATIARLVGIIGDKAEQVPEVRDILWHAAWPVLNTATAQETGVLSKNLRPDQTVRDAAEAAGAIERALGHDEAQLFIARVRGSINDEATRKQLDDATRR